MDSDRLSHARLWAVHHRGVVRRTTRRCAGIDSVSPVMSFFITSTGRDSAAIWGLPERTPSAAACGSRRTRVSNGARYLSAPASAVRLRNARDRVGAVPVQRARAQIASSVDTFRRSREPARRHSPSRGPVGPHAHDILTGVPPMGHVVPTRCHGQGWTSHGDGRAMVGHHNRSGAAAATRELRSSVARLFAGGAARVARRRTALLLRRRLERLSLLCSRGPLSMVLGARSVLGPWYLVLRSPWTQDLGLRTDQEPSTKNQRLGWALQRSESARRSPFSSSRRRPPAIHIPTRPANAP